MPWHPERSIGSHLLPLLYPKVRFCTKTLQQATLSPGEVHAYELKVIEAIKKDEHQLSVFPRPVNTRLSIGISVDSPR